MLVRKTLSLSDCDIKIKGDTANFAGYASVFGGVDSYGDTILRGAFDYTLRNNGKPKMFYNHEWDLPIGKYTVAKEDDHGLYVEGEFTPGITKAAEVHAALQHGTLDGLSIGGYLKSGDYDETADGGRIIRRWSSLVEVSPVIFPADGAARIDLGSVKSEDIEKISSIKEFERLLRDAGPFSRDQAKHLIARFKAIIATAPEAEGEEVTQRLEARAAALAASYTLISRKGK